VVVISTVIIPAYNEGANILKTLQDLSKLYGDKISVLVVVDSAEDSTISYFDNAEKPDSYELLIQNYGPGPANAIRYGIDRANTACVTVMMADGSDDVRAISELSNLVSRGVAVACASRYMSGGQQIGGQRFKKFLSRSAGKSLFIFAGIGTHDPTNSFKSYSRDFLVQVEIESRSGFEIGIELVAKAHRLRLPVAEIPTIWLDRTFGESRFQVAKWAPKYLRWYFFCFGPKSKTTQR
jgi:glycosyltransferase involved in cell wall biosynthesis